MFKRVVNFVVVVALMLPLMACNTVKGFGQDLQNGGKAIVKRAEKSQQ